MSDFLDLSGIKDLDVETINNFTVVDINNVARWVMSEWQENKFNEDKWITCVAPQFTRALFKFLFRLNRKVHDERWGFTTPGADSAYVGVLVEATPIDGPEDKIQRKAVHDIHKIDTENIKFLVQMSFFFSHREDLKNSISTGGVMIYLDKEGLQVGNPYYRFDREELTRLTYFIEDSISGGMLGNVGLTPDDEPKSIAKEIMEGNMNGFMTPVLVAISLMHCKNIDLIDKPVKRHQLRRMERTGEPLIVEKVLEIDAFKNRVVNQRQGHGTGLQRAMHICRGHFREYTENNKLFGKYTGKYWIPQHSRGSKGIGKVNKEYKVL